MSFCDIALIYVLLLINLGSGLSEEERLNKSANEMHVNISKFELTPDNNICYNASLNCSNTNLNNYQTAPTLNQTKSQTEVSLHTITIALVIYSLIFVIGFFGNGLVIIIAFFNQTQHHSFGTTNYCLVNLSVADLLLIIVCLPSAILDLFSQEVWYLGHFLCKKFL